MNGSPSLSRAWRFLYAREGAYTTLSLGVIAGLLIGEPLGLTLAVGLARCGIADEPVGLQCRQLRRGTLAIRAEHRSKDILLHWAKRISAQPNVTFT